jgi:hypothetical protein
MNIDKLIEFVEKKAKEKLLYEEHREEYKDQGFYIDDYAGGNIDDSYSLGREDGEISFAREVLNLIKSLQDGVRQ